MSRYVIPNKLNLSLAAGEDEVLRCVLNIASALELANKGRIEEKWQQHMASAVPENNVALIQTLGAGILQPHDILSRD